MFNEAASLLLLFLISMWKCIDQFKPSLDQLKEPGSTQNQKYKNPASLL